MGQIFTRPISAEQKAKLDEKKRPSQEDILHAQDELFMNLFQRVKKLEDNQQGGDSYD